jgi:hypothetical protein
MPPAENRRLGGKGVAWRCEHRSETGNATPAAHRHCVHGVPRMDISDAERPLRNVIRT